MFSDKTSSGYNTAKVAAKKYWSFLNKLSLFASWLAGTKFKNVKSDLAIKNALSGKLESQSYFLAYIFII